MLSGPSVAPRRFTGSQESHTIMHTALEPCPSHQHTQRVCSLLLRPAQRLKTREESEERNSWNPSFSTSAGALSQQQEGHPLDEEPRCDSYEYIVLRSLGLTDATPRTLGFC